MPMNELFELLKFGLGHVNTINIPNQTNWKDIYTLAFKHGVGAIALDGLQRCYDENIPVDIDKIDKRKWIGAVNRQEKKYGEQESNTASLAQFYQKHGIRMMILKGWGLSFYYPIPSHRPSSDLDIYLFGEQERADKLIKEELGIKINGSHHHHTVFSYKGLTVENHFDFLNVYSHLSSRKIEKELKSLAQDAESVKMKDGTEVWLPPENFNALFLLRHMAVEFAATGMNLRQVLDWGLFVKRYHTKVDWMSILPIVKDLNMHNFLDAVNYICYTYLGFEKSIFVGFGNACYGERVYADLFNPENSKPKEKGFVKYVLSRIRKWWKSRWKHRIVYSDGLFSTFVFQLYAHLVKPASLHN